MDNEGLRIKDWESTKRRKEERGEGRRDSGCGESRPPWPDGYFGEDAGKREKLERRERSVMGSESWSKRV